MQQQVTADSANAELTPELLTWLEQRHGVGSAAQLSVRRVWLPRRGTEQQIVQLPATLEGPQRYAVRRVAAQGDWIARATGDERQQVRELRLRDALGRSLPQPLRMAALDVLPLDDGSSLLITPVWSPPADAAAHATRLVAALATLHTGCATFPARLTATLGLVPTGAWLTLYAPQTGVREVQRGGELAVAADEIPALLQTGWEAFADAAPDAWLALAPLLADPAPLVRALRGLPETLLHGSPAPGVVFAAEAGEGAPVLLDDWRQALRAPGALDLAAFLAGLTIEQQPWPADPQALIETYRAARAAGGRLPASGLRWERELALALLAGAMRAGWAAALALRDSVSVDDAQANAQMAFWCDAALAGVAALHADAGLEEPDALGAG